MDINKATAIIETVEDTNNISTDPVENTTTNNASDIPDNSNNKTANSEPTNNNTAANNNTLTGREKSNITGTKNLISLADRTREEQQKIARAGGIKSGETRRRRKTARELLDKMLQSNLSEDQIEEILGTAASMLSGDNTVYNVMLAKMAQQAMSGDTKAFIALRDTAGDKPIEQSVTLTDSMSDEDRKQIDKMRKQLMDISKIV